ncbi:type VII secretion target [Nocardia sp. NPDC058176]|uniref:type VII secretion target n=1 Tax=Nocardia sp. NPDC058176 TaxID=3346368 RepID=UPI0036DD63D5
MTSKQVQVAPGAIRAHAAKVGAVAVDLAGALEAASYLAHADDGYGTLVRPYAAMILTDLHDSITEALTTLDELTGAMPGKLRTAADAFENRDGSFAGDIAARAAEIAGRV